MMRLTWLGVKPCACAAMMLLFAGRDKNSRKSPASLEILLNPPFPPVPFSFSFLEPSFSSFESDFLILG